MDIRTICALGEVKRAAKRLRLALREAAGIPRIDVVVNYQDGRATLTWADFGGKQYGLGELRSQEDPPRADIRVIVQPGHWRRLGLVGRLEVASGEWDGEGTISGRVDPDGAMSLFAEDDVHINWDDFVETERRKSQYPPAPPDKQLPLFPMDSSPTNSVADKLLPISDARGANFAQTLDVWVRNLGSNLAEFENLDLGSYVRCEQCGKVVPEDEAASAWEQYYCGEHAPDYCAKCKEPIAHDEGNYTEDGYYCNDCYMDYEEIWEEFYHKHPKLREIDALKDAENEDEMEPGVYVTIFGGLPWSDGYGGRAWAHIAETWRDLGKALIAKDHAKLHLLIDHSFDLVHNTGPLFTKAKDSVQKWLFQALEEKFFLDPLQFRSKLSADVRKLLDLHIRDAGGVSKWKENIKGREAVMAEFEKALLNEGDSKMAGRLWAAYELEPNAFRGRDSFLEVAFWADDRTTDSIRSARRVKKFLQDPRRETAGDALSAIRPHILQVGTAHPAGPALRDEFILKLFELLDDDPVFRRELKKPVPELGIGSDEETKETMGKGFRRPYWWSEWDKFLTGERRRRTEAEEELAVAVALSDAFLKVALSSTDFYDFYALSLVGCERMPNDDIAQMCRALKKANALDVARSLLSILSRAVVREARHVADQLSRGGW